MCDLALFCLIEEKFDIEQTHNKNMDKIQVELVLLNIALLF
jgi:hypothetical protein